MGKYELIKEMNFLKHIMHFFKILTASRSFRKYALVIDDISS